VLKPPKTNVFGGFTHVSRETITFDGIDSCVGDVSRETISRRLHERTNVSRETLRIYLRCVSPCR